LTERYDAIIVGAGIIGCSIGYQLAKFGWRTINIDKMPTSGQGSTSNSLAIVRTHYSTLEGSALAWEGYHCWNNWRHYLGSNRSNNIARFIKTGALVIQTENNNKLSKQIALSKQLKIPFEEWSSLEIGKHFPLWDLRSYGPPILSDNARFGIPTAETIHGGVFFPKAGYCNDPRLATQNIQRATELAGGKFRFKSEVSKIRKSNNRVLGITLSDGTIIDAPVIVNAAGPYSQILNQLAGIEQSNSITTRVVRHEALYLKLPSSCEHHADSIITYDADIGSYIRPDQDGSVFVGSQGTSFDDYNSVDPDNFEENIGSLGDEPIYRLGQRIPELGIPNRIRGIVGLWDITEDWIPIYDCSDLNGFYLAIGTSGNQFKTAPVVGELMASLILACESGHNHDTEPLEFVLRRTGSSIQLDFFSRNRTVNNSSSFSVLG